MRLALLVLLAAFLASDASRLSWELDAACEAEHPLPVGGAAATLPAVPQPRPGCFFQPDFRCDKDDKCGQEVCPVGKACAKVKKTIEKQIVVEDPFCEDPKLVCKEIKKQCGPKEEGLFCNYDENCISQKICKKVQCGPYTKNVCKDEYKCEKIDPQVCTTEQHQVCVARDPKSYDPGYFKGYALGWEEKWETGQICGTDICKPGSFCATCEVEVCLDDIVQKSAAQCGFDPVKLAPSFCPEGYMCVELCKKTIQQVVEVPVCADPFDPLYTNYFEYQACGDQKCGPGFKCTKDNKEVCPPVGGASGAVEPYGSGYASAGFPSAAAGALAGSGTGYGLPSYGYTGAGAGAGAGAGEGSYGEPFYGYSGAGVGAGAGAGIGSLPQPYSDYSTPFAGAATGAGDGSFVEPQPSYPGAGLGAGAGYGAGYGTGYGTGYSGFPSTSAGAGAGYPDTYYPYPAAGAGAGAAGGNGYDYGYPTTPIAGAAGGKGYDYGYPTTPIAGAGAGAGAGAAGGKGYDYGYPDYGYPDYGYPDYGYPDYGYDYVPTGAGAGYKDTHDYLIYAPGESSGQKGGFPVGDSNAIAKGGKAKAEATATATAKAEAKKDEYYKPVYPVDPSYTVGVPDVKPVDVKPVDLKPVDLKPIDLKPVDLKPIDLKPVDLKPVDLKPVDLKPVDLKPVDLKPVDFKPVDLKPVDFKPVDLKPIDLKPVDLKPVDFKPVDLKPIDVKPVDLKPIDFKPVDLKPIDFKPVDLKPVDVKPVKVTPVLEVGKDFGKKSSAKSVATATATDDLVTVWGSSKTSGDGKADFKALADTYTKEGSTALHADIVGGSGPGEDGDGFAKVDCNTSAANGAAKCDGTASHNP